MASRTEKTKYLIIGNSAGGIGAAESIREVDKAGVITIISDESYPAYSRPLISDYLVNRYPIDKMLFRSPDFYVKNNIRTIFGERVLKINFNECTAEIESGRNLTWQKMLLATGGLPIVPALNGYELRGVFTFTKLDDAKAIDQFICQCQKKIRAVVIGGGLIGVSVTEALVKRGVEVTIIEMKDRILNTILDEEASTIEDKALKEAGVEIITGNTVRKINGNLTDEITSVNLDNGLSISCNMVIIAIGVRPRMELVSNSGIKINRGIIVNRYMSTSIANVYACGDVAEAYDLVYCENRLTPIWPIAYIGGRIAGLNMANTITEYPGGTAMNAMKYFGIAITSAGIVVPPDDSYDVISQKHDHVYKKVILKDGLIVGMVFSGDIEKSGIIYNLIKDKLNVIDIKHALITDDFGLASLPKEIWKPRLKIPPELVGFSVAHIEQNEEELIGE